MTQLYKEIYYAINRGTSLTDQIQIRMTRPFYQSMKKEGMMYLNSDEEFKYFMGVPLLIVPGYGKWCQVVKSEIVRTWFLNEE